MSYCPVIIKFNFMEKLPPINPTNSLNNSLNHLLFRLFSALDSAYKNFKVFLMPLVDILPLNAFSILMLFSIIFCISIVFATLFTGSSKNHLEHRASLSVSTILSKLLNSSLCLLLIPGVSSFNLDLFDCSFIYAISIYNFIIFILSLLVISRILRKKREIANQESLFANLENLIENLESLLVFSAATFCCLVGSLWIESEILMVLGAISILLQVELLRQYFT